ncbi:MAG: methylenetetrahydrofolate reductase, partial [Alphaproteobacteria bacterium]|nr:methylenetetrahydrofolate reductase [Alphaproteobacteria bacterium]
REHLGEYLKEARGQAGIDKALVIAGDLNRPKGPYASSLDVISDDIFLKAGLTEIGIAGYPEGHPLIDDRTIDAELGLKINTLILANMSVEIVTQFSFDAGAIVAWYDRLRRQGIICPIRIGLAGPASAATLLNLALRCGVNLPLRQTNKAAQLLRGASTQEIVASLAASPEIADSPHTVALHMYSFGGIARTAEWASELAAEG